MPAKRVLIISNKWWETDPLCGVLIHDKARPADLANFRYIRFPAPRLIAPKPADPRPSDPKLEPRLAFECVGVSVELWCLEEIMNPAENSSSSLEKFRVLQNMMKLGDVPNLVIAFGTAGSREGVQNNGSVVIGRRVFIHEPRAGVSDRTGFWTPPQSGQIIDSDFPAKMLAEIVNGQKSRYAEESRYAAEARFLKSPITPASPPITCIGNSFTSLGVVNITNYDDYTWADSEATAAFQAAKTGTQIGSIETTHGIIRSASKAPFLFVSGITDTEGLFDYQVTPQVYAQNFVAAHNAALAIAWLLPSLLTEI